jgi:phosphoglycolate phosphatase-like HAD superfamily hydrolase
VIRCVVFDFDGTLVDSNHIKHQSFIEIAKAFDNGASLMEAILMRENTGDRYWVFREFASALPVKVDAMVLADRYTQFCENRIVNAPEIAGVSSALDRLSKDGKLLYVNSATPTEPLAKLICLRGMERWFNGIYGAPNSKSENLIAIMKQCGAQTQEMLMVGDSESDRMAAENIRCHFVGVRNKENNFQECPRHLIDDLNDVHSYISGMSLSTVNNVQGYAC